MMNLSLAYRVLTSPLYYSFPDSEHLNKSAVADRIKALAGRIKRAPKIRADNVAAYFAMHDRDVWDSSNDIPNWAPPFCEFFIEWNVPKAFNIRGEIVSPPGESQEGLFVTAVGVDGELSESSESDKIAFANDIGRFFTGVKHLSIDGHQACEMIDGATYILVLEHWYSMKEKPLCGLPGWCGVQAFVSVDKNGRFITSKFAGIGLLASDGDFWGMSGFQSAIDILGLTTSFMHCKNVVRTIHEERPSAGFVKQKKCAPCLKYHVLDINPMKEVLRREGGIETNGIQKALHICRGHFVHYSEERPLFGKYSGTFWKPDHVRGNAERGIVVKDYNVKPGVIQ